MGATFGGSSQTVFGTDGPLPLLNKVTTAAAVIFMVTSISLAYLSAHKSTSSVMQDLSVQKPQESAIERAPEPLPEPASDIPLAPADVPLTQEAPSAMMATEPMAEAPVEAQKAVEEVPVPATGGQTESKE